MKNVFRRFIAGVAVVAIASCTSPVFAQFSNPGIPAQATAGNGLSQSGSTIGIAAPVSLANGGTAATTQPAALANILGTSQIPIANGGTNASTQPAALANILGSSTVPIANGGTNAATQTGALANILGSSAIPIANGGTAAVTAQGATANIQYQATATGSVARSVTSKLSDQLYFGDFGGKCDGTTNDDAAFTAALAAITTNSRLNFPKGICVFSTAHTFPTLNNVTIAGAGSTATEFLYTGTGTTGDLFTLGNGTTSISGWLFQGFSINSNTTMTSGSALHLRRMQNGNTMNDVSVGTFGSSTNKIYDGIWLDNVNVFKFTNSNDSVQNEALKMNGSPTSDEGSDIFLDNIAITFSSIGYHVGGGQGGIYFGKTLAYGNNVNYQIDNALATRLNREIFFSDQSVSDGSKSYGVWFNDSLTSNAPVVMNGAFGSAGLIGPVANIPEIYIEKWANGRFSYGAGEIYNATGDGIKIDDASVQIAIDPSRYIFNNGGYGVNATTAYNQLANQSQFMYANTLGNYSSNVQPLPFAVTSNMAVHYSAGSQAGYFLQVGNNLRWAFQTDGTAETGSNAGSNLYLSAYSDAGAYINSWLQINRATGKVTFPGVISASNGALPVYQASGTAVTNAHAVVGFVNLSGGAATVTFSGSAVFSSSASYTCNGHDDGNSNAVYFKQSSGTSLAVTGTGGDAIFYSCIGD